MKTKTTTLEKFKHYRRNHKGGIEGIPAADVERMIREDKLGRSYLIEGGNRVNCVFPKPKYFNN